MGATEPLEPEVVAALEAIDATLQGEPVDPELAELAELALILRDDRPAADPAFLRRLDRRVQDRFARDPRSSRTSERRARWRTWRAAWVPATIAVVVAASVGGIVIDTGGHSPVASSSGVNGSASSASAAASSTSAAASSAGGASSAARATSAAPHATSGSAKVPSSAPVPRGGHDIAQTAQLTLRARAGRIDAVAQQVFDAIAAEHGSVASSNVSSESAGPSSGQFELRVPSARLEATLDRLSRLHGAHVIARSDSSADVAPQIDSTSSRLAVAHALHRSLLRQLAAADTGAQAGRLESELRRNTSAIAGDEAALTRLRGRVSDSSIAVVITAPATRHVHHRAHGSGFSIGSALHDAGHILLVAAGVALIALAVLVPLGLVVAVCAWVWSLVLRRRREGALGT